MDKLLFYATIFCAFLPLILIFAYTPYISRKGTHFGVLLNDDAKSHPRIKKINHTYTYFAVILGSVLSFSQILYNSYLALQLSVIIYVTLCIALYFFNNKTLKNIISIERLENMQRDIHLNFIPRGGVKNAISLYWYLIYIIIIGTTIFKTLKTPIKFSLFIPSIQLTLSIIIIIIHLIIFKSNYFADKREIESSIESNIYFRRKWSIFTFISGLSINIVLLLLQFNFLGLIGNTIVLTASPFILTIIITLFAIVFAKNISK